MAVSIFQADPPDFMASRPAGTKYLHVADVATDDLEVAYELTNSINRGWWENEGVTKTFTKAGCRSTSVGDMAIHNGVTYLCDMVGWKKLDGKSPLPAQEG